MGIAPDKKGNWEDLETPVETATVVATEVTEVEESEVTTDDKTTVE